MTADERTIYRHSVEALIQRVVLRSGLLSVEFDRELRALGIDASKPDALPLKTWIALLYATAQRLKPELSQEDALEQVGRAQLRAYSEGIIGHALLMALRLRGPRAALSTLMKSFRTSDNFTTVEVRELSPSSVELSFNSPQELTPYMRGLLFGVMQAIRAPAPTVDSRQLLGGTQFIVSWKP